MGIFPASHLRQNMGCNAGNVDIFFKINANLTRLCGLYFEGLAYGVLIPERKVNAEH